MIQPATEETERMTEQRSRVICVGETMVELARGADGRFGIGCGGDTFNTAIYLARAGLPTAFATALGSDPYSEGIIALADAEKIATDLILRVPGGLVGLYLIDIDPDGARHYYHWCDTAPARELFEHTEWTRVAEALIAARLIYFSGNALAPYSNVGLGRFLAVLEMARKGGAKIAFDGNFRPRVWKGDLARARTVFTEVLKRADIALPAFDDEAVLWGDPSPESTAERMQAFGITEVVVKNGPNSVLVAADGRQEFVPVPQVMEQVGAAAAGDAFNAGYIAARLSGESPTQATAAAHRRAGEALRNQGAVSPRTAMH